MQPGKPIGSVMNQKERGEHEAWKRAYLKRRKENPRRALELGMGPRAKKAVDLALRHKKTLITAVDHWPKSEHMQYLRALGKSKPENLIIKTKQDALDCLKSKKGNYYSHIYAHFLLQHLSFAKRTAIVKELMRVLKPGSKFITVEQYHVSRQIPLEFQRAGFKVAIRPMSIQQLITLGTDSGDRNAQRAIDTEVQIAAARALGGTEAEEALKRTMINGGWLQLMETARQNGDLESPEAREALETIMADEARQFTHSHFFVITATKPRTK